MKPHDRRAYNRVWLITESSSDLGRAVAEAVLARGERAVVTARTPERVRDLIERYPAQALVLELDVSRRDQVRSVVAQATDRFGRIDVLVNNVDGFAQALAQQLASLGTAVIVAEARGSDDPATAAEAIIAAVDARAIPQK